MLISDWSSDVCSSNLLCDHVILVDVAAVLHLFERTAQLGAMLDDAERAAGFQRLVERIEGLLFETAADPVVAITKRQHDIGAAGRCDVGTLWRREFADRDFAETRRIGLEVGLVSGDAVDRKSTRLNSRP